MFKSVLFPDPLGPTMERLSPASNRREQSRKMESGPDAVEKSLWTCDTIRAKRLPRSMLFHFLEFLLPLSIKFFLRKGRIRTFGRSQENQDAQSETKQNKKIGQNPFRTLFIVIGKQKNRLEEKKDGEKRPR